MRNEKSESIASDISDKARDMFPELCEARSEEEFEMYSYGNAAEEFWRSMAYNLTEKGLTENQIKELFQSKYMRWMFDQMTDEMDSLTKSLIENDRNNMLEYGLSLEK